MVLEVWPLIYVVSTNLFFLQSSTWFFPLTWIPLMVLFWSNVLVRFSFNTKKKLYSPFLLMERISLVGYFSYLHVIHYGLPMCLSSVSTWLWGHNRALRRYFYMLFPTSLLGKHGRMKCSTSKRMATPSNVFSHWSGLEINARKLAKCKWFW